MCYIPIFLNLYRSHTSKFYYKYLLLDIIYQSIIYIYIISEMKSLFPTQAQQPQIFNYSHIYLTKWWEPCNILQRCIIHLCLLELHFLTSLSSPEPLLSSQISSCFWQTLSLKNIPHFLRKNCSIFLYSLVVQAFF